MTDPSCDALLQNTRDIVTLAFSHDPASAGLIVYDTDSPLTRLLREGYGACLTGAAQLDVAQTPLEPIIAAIDALPRGALVVLLQSDRFELGPWRFRLELFKRGLKVIEHPHLGRVRDEEVATYVAALAYDPRWLRGMGAALKARIDPAGRITLITAAGRLDYEGPFEDTKQNVGDYSGMETVGGQFPIGEVFTEPVTLESLSGRVTIGAFGAADFSVRFLTAPITLEIVEGRVVAAPGATEEFEEVLRVITESEGAVWVRELGFGLNRALSPATPLTDVGSYERMCGVHISLGTKHTVYPKAGFSKRHTRYHVDVFAALGRVEIDGQTVFADGAYTLAPLPIPA